MDCKPLVGIAISFTLDTTYINMKLNMDMDGFSYRQKRQKQKDKKTGGPEGPPCPLQELEQGGQRPPKF